MGKKKYFYYIGIIEDDKIKLVTEIDRIKKTALWGGKDAPCAVSELTATDTADGFCMNFIPAVVIKSRFEIKRQIYCDPDNVDSTEENEGK